MMQIQDERGWPRTEPLRSAGAIAMAMALTAVTGCYGGVDAAPPGLDPGAEGSGGGVESSAGDEGSEPPAAADGCDPSEDAGPRRIWRLSQRQYENTVTAMLHGRPADSDASIDRLELPDVFTEAALGDRFSNNATSYSMNDLEFESALAAAEVVSEAWQGQLTPDCFEDQMVDCVREQVRARGAVLFSRPLLDPEVEGYVERAVAAAGELDPRSAVELTLQSLLMAPQFLFRAELGEPQGDGLYRLTPYEIAAALSYSLTDRPPDQALWDAASRGDLERAEVIVEHAHRLLDSPAAASQPRFFAEYLHYGRSAAVFKDTDRFPEHDGAGLADDTARWLEHLLETRAEDQFLVALLTEPTAFVQPSTAAAYGVSVSSDEPVLVEFEPEQRAGFLTQPAFLVGFSHDVDNDPVNRGRFISESLLCRDVPPLPIEEVPPIPEPAEDATLRDRLEAHRSDPKCSVCHRMMDPLAMPFEQYDHLGRFRTMEAGRPVDTTTTVEQLGPLDGAYEGPADYVQALASSERVRRCFVRHNFQYWMGRPESAADACALDRLTQTFSEAGDYRGLVVGLFVSTPFLIRTDSE